MHFFAIQVSTGYETQFKQKLLFKLEKLFTTSIHIPVHIKPIRKQGTIKSNEQIVFPGYVFLEYPEKELPLQLITLIQKVPYFVRILPQTLTPIPLSAQDTQLLTYFFQPKNKQISTVYFDENDRIVVVDGILKDLEGYIIKVNKRKQRAKVRIDMCNTPFIIEVAFENIQKKDNA